MQYSKKFLVAIVFSIAAIVAASAFDNSSPVETTYSGLKEAIRKRVGGNLSKDGVYAAYAHHISRGVVDSHSLEHILGEVLYESLGDEGFKLCPDSDLMGCFHGFLISRSENGTTADYKTLCRTTALMEKISCVHGLGHGIYLSSNTVNNGLEECASLFPKSDALASICSTGVLMEYHVKGADHRATSIMPFDESNPYDPCPRINQPEQKRYCYWELPHWWKTVLKNDLGRMDSLCSAIVKAPPYHYNEWCYRGIGESITVDRNYQPGEIALYCGRLSAEGSLYCITEAARLLLGRRGISPAEICNYLGREQLAEQCLAKATSYIETLIQDVQNDN